MFSSLFNRIPGRLETASFVLFYLLCRIRFRYYDENSIKDYQGRRAREILKHARGRSVFFRSLYSDFNTDEFFKLPTVNKKLMMNNLTGYNTVGFTRDEIINFCLEVEKSRDFKKRLRGINVGMSSGTSGNKGVEIVTPAEERYMKAAFFARFSFPEREKLNLAFILRVSAPAFSLNRFGHKLTYISQLNNIGSIREQLENLNPNVISAPPSMLRILAGEAEKGRLNVKLRRVVSYAEVLHSDVKEYLVKIFDCPVHEIYKCTEGPIAISCKYGSLHINEDLVLVETLNDDNSQTPAGQPCRKLIITDLHKRSQPVIRYELNDIITISPARCRCGSSFRVVESIQGRADDVFWARSMHTGEWQYIFPDYISRAVIASSDDIDEFQVIQEKPEEVNLILKLKESCKESDFKTEPVIAGIVTVFEKYGCTLPEVNVIIGTPVVNKNSNKLIRIHRNFNPENLNDE